MKKNILIVSPFFAPENEIAAVRATKFAKYLSIDGYQVTVICKRKRASVTDAILSADSEWVSKVVRLECPKLMRYIYRLVFRRDYYAKTIRENGEDTAPTTSLPSVTRLKPSALKVKTAAILNQFFAWWDELAFVYSAKKQIKNDAISYSCVFSTFGPQSGHLIAEYVKRSGLAKQWVADFRDNVKQQTGDYTKQDIRYLDMVMRESDAITTVGHNTMPYYAGSNKLFVLTNGYDLDDTASSKQEIGNEKLTFAYTGTLYGGKRDCSVFFRALRDLDGEGRLALDNITVEYAGRDIGELLSQAEPYGCSDIVNNHGYIDREQSLRLQKNADVLLLASWNKAGSEGIVTGKFYEYLLMKKPIVCLISGNLPNSELGMMIHKTNTGLTYEESRNDIDYIRLKDYLMTLYNEFMESGRIACRQDDSSISQFDYRNLVKELEELLD